MLQPAWQLRSHGALLWALGLSLALHASLLTLRWAAPAAFDRIFQASPLEVVLVNATSLAAPDTAQALAQVNLAGGGQTPGNRLRSSPLPASQQEPTEQQLQALERKIEALKTEQLRLLEQLQQEWLQLNRESSNTAPSSEKDLAKTERKNQLNSQLAQIERETQSLQAGPRKRYIGPSTRETAYAAYYDKFRRSIETTGTENFPHNGTEKLYGALTMVISLDALGKVLQTEVAQGSGNALLDQRAQAIVRGAAPFGAFSAIMRKQADQLVVVTRFNFARDETLETRLLVPGPRP
jgi:protein TonB